MDNPQVQFYNQLFGSFLEECFGLYLEDIEAEVEYMSKFFQLTLTYELPSAVTNKEEGQEGESKSYEDFLSY